MTVMTKYNEAQ